MENVYMKTSNSFREKILKAKKYLQKQVKLKNYETKKAGNTTSCFEKAK